MPLLRTYILTNSKFNFNIFYYFQSEFLKIPLLYFLGFLTVSAAWLNIDSVREYIHQQIFVPSITNKNHPICIYTAVFTSQGLQIFVNRGYNYIINL